MCYKSSQKKNVAIIIIGHKSLPVRCYFILEQTIKKVQTG